MKKASSSPRETSSFQFWVMAGFLIVVFLTGGTSRIDAGSLMILEPASIMVCGLAAFTVRREHLAERRWTTAIALMTIVLFSIPILPLPSWLYSLGGSKIVEEVDILFGGEKLFRPIALVPQSSLQSFFSLFTPLAIFLLGIQLNRNDLFRILPLLIILIATSGILGVLQITGSPDGPLYPYKFTNNGSAVGLLANRNHSALLLSSLLPMLVAFLLLKQNRQSKFGSHLVLIPAAFVALVPLILITGSRSGLLLFVLGFCGAAVLYQTSLISRITGDQKQLFNMRSTSVFVAIAAIGLVVLTLFFARAEAIERLFEQSVSENARTDIWRASINLMWKSFPFGVGTGSYAEAFLTEQPADLLGEKYVNHAHNDWIETAVTLGAAGIAFLLLISIGYLFKSYGVWRDGRTERSNVIMGRMSSIVIAMLALASFSDYPLRTPIFMSFVTIITLWLTASKVKSRVEAQMQR